MPNFKSPIFVFSALCAIFAGINPVLSWACFLITILSCIRINFKAKDGMREMTADDIMKIQIEKYSFHKPVHALKAVFGEKPRSADYIDDFQSMSRKLAMDIHNLRFSGIDFDLHVKVNTYVAFGSTDELVSDFIPLSNVGQNTVQTIALLISKAQGKKIMIEG